MTIAYTNFFAPTVLTTGAVTLYTVPATPSTSLLRGGRMRLTNTTGLTVPVTLYAVPTGGTAGVSNAFASNKNVPANDYLDVDVPIMPTGAFIQALAASATSITAHMISGSLFQ
jgi:hypothetical protein